MTISDISLAEEQQTDVAASSALSRRDLYLLPLLSLATIVIMLSVSEIAARVLWPMQTEDSCRVLLAGTGSRFRPNCISRAKIPESSWIQNSYNNCGFRSRESCATKRPGTIRVAVLGTSISYGYMNPVQNTYTALAGAALSRQCRRPVEFQNLGVPNLSLVGIYRRMPEALALKPDMVLLTMSALDLRSDISAKALADRDLKDLDLSEVAPALPSNWMKRNIVEPLKQSRAIYMLQHYMFQNPDTYLDLYLLYGDKVGFLKQVPSPMWQGRFAGFDTILGALSDQARASSVPLVVMIAPVASQVALANAASRPGLDANAFSSRIEAIGAKHHVPVINPLPEMTNVSRPMGLLYVVDGHIAQRGQQILADVLDRQLRSGQYGAFQHCDAGPEAGRERSGQ